MRVSGNTLCFIPEITTIEIFNKDYDLYAAVLLPNTTDFITLEDTNKFTLINQVKKIVSSKKINHIDRFNFTNKPTNL
ncbi:MAG: hypothetical protein QM487_08600 [Candidatus Marithrix sp.]